eukprot:g19569.t1
MPRQLHFRAPSQEELVQLRDLHDRGYYEAAFRAFMDPTGRRSSNRTLPLETQQAGFLAGYMLLREALDEQRQVGSPLTHLKLTWTNSTELDNLDHIDRCFIQELFKWLFTLPLGQMQLAVSEVPRDLHQDSKDLVAKRACRLPAIAAGMQLHPVEDKCCDSALGELLVKRGGVRAWLRLATLAGRIRTVQVVQWALDHENFLQIQEVDETNLITSADAAVFRSIVGMGIYLSQERLDLSFVIKELASKMSKYLNRLILVGGLELAAGSRHERVGNLAWLIDNFGVAMWKECNINLACRSKSFPPQILQAPPRILPKLSEVEEEEALVRFRYWVSLLVLSPYVMACDALNDLS